ncbi:MAG TPA: type ISP restriction/modification enzyme, partial [Dongiaceae bacterium]|nr:type ISP restriction/modification enzyme [Dongiaceae bacterium]
GKEDPVVHFYETFLAAYDPKMRRVRGVYYTPEAVVSYIVRSIDRLLKTRFNRPKGLADENTLILDPATGTAPFLCFVIDRIHRQVARQTGAWDGYVDKHLLNRVFGFELLIAPYAIAHFRLGRLLQETGYTFASGRRVGVYLTSTLEEAARKSEELIANRISEEANAAKMNRDAPILVVLGNPPYSNFGQMNRGEWILGLLRDYKKDLNETKLNLDDDFIKFIRFAQWRLERTGGGIVGFITNNAYLDGLTHRRMRECLLTAFNEIYVLDLHGSSQKPEAAPGDLKDENVFDITLGVSIVFFLKLPRAKGCRLFHADLWGGRQAKYQALWETDASVTQWLELKPVSPHFYFVPRDLSQETEYRQGWSLREVFLVSGNAVKTERDRVSIHLTQEGVRRAVEDFRHLDEAALRRRFDLEQDSRDWKVASARADVLARRDPNCFRPILYRPFDTRFTWYSGQSKGFIGTPGRAVMRHILAGDNVALLACRQQAVAGFQHVFCARGLAECCSVSLRTREITSAFPLYLYGEGRRERSRKDAGSTLLTAFLETAADYGERRANLNPKFIEDVTQRVGLKWVPLGRGDLKKTVGPEDMFHYAYALLHSPTYRSRYAEFLKIDFPRLPLTSDRKLFRALAGPGRELIALHLMDSPRLNGLITEFPVRGDNKIQEARYTDNDQRVWINSKQYFSGVPKAVWQFHVGGYQVCEKWLKDRKSRTATCDDLEHYQKIVVAVQETLRLMAEIDSAIEHHGGRSIS